MLVHCLTKIKQVGVGGVVWRGWQLCGRRKRLWLVSSLKDEVCMGSRVTFQTKAEQERMRKTCEWNGLHVLGQRGEVYGSGTKNYTARAHLSML